MPKITVDGIEYNTEDLSENGKAQLASIQFLEVQMNKLESEILVYQTARNSYVATLKVLKVLLHFLQIVKQASVSNLAQRKSCP